jgi:GT2 family glycosyltransferase
VAESEISFSVIVPVYNGAQTLGVCLDALSDQTVGADTCQIIVVDDGSSDDSAGIAQRYRVTVLRQEHAGAGPARNLGARLAESPILLFTDADCQPQRDWIEKMAAPFESPEVAGVKGVYGTRQHSRVARFAQAEYEEKYKRQARLPLIDFVDTYAAAYRRDVFWAHGGFDPKFLLDEDQELSFRLSKAGHKLVLALDARVYHLHPDTVWRYFRRKLHLGRWKVPVHARHPRKALRDSYTPWSQKAQLALLPLFLGTATIAVAGGVSWLVPALLAAVGLVTTLPLLREAQRQGWDVAVVVPFLVLLRALALDLGLAWGTWSQLIGRS